MRIYLSYLASVTECLLRKRYKSAVENTLGGTLENKKERTAFLFVFKGAPPNDGFYWHCGEVNILSVEGHKKLSYEENKYSKPVSSLGGYSVPIFVEWTQWCRRGELGDTEPP